jgi:hypothetical protein
MKTERRHELQTNVLADSLARWIESAKPYSRAALAIVIAVAAAVFAWGYYSSQATRRQADGWDQFYDAMNARDPREGLSDVVETYAGTPVAQWARVVLADIELDEGTNRQFVDKAGGREQLKKTIEDYLAVLSEGGPPMLLQRATFGLARAREALGEKLAVARKEYESIATNWPDSPFAAAATARAKDLERLDTKNFYDWFVRYEPPRPMAREPGQPGARPDFLNDPLEGAGLNLPSILDDKSSLTTPPAETPGTPAGDDAKPDESPPADEKPAEPAKPDDAEPAEPEPAPSK